MGLYTELLEGQQGTSEKPNKTTTKQKEKGQSVKKGSAASDKVNSTASSTAVNTANSTAIHIFDEADYDDLKAKTYLPRTFKMSDRDAEWLEDTAYRLSKEVRPRRVFQVDIVRLGMKLFENLLSVDKQQLLKILKEIR